MAISEKIDKWLAEKALKAQKRLIWKYFLNIMIGLDQLLNALTAGDADETVSSRLGKIKREHGGTIPAYKPIAKTLDWLLDKVDRNHSIDAIEEDEGKDSVAWDIPNPYEREYPDETKPKPKDKTNILGD